MLQTDFITWSSRICHPSRPLRSHIFCLECSHPAPTLPAPVFPVNSCASRFRGNASPLGWFLDFHLYPSEGTDSSFLPAWVELSPGICYTYMLLTVPPSQSLMTSLCMLPPPPLPKLWWIGMEPQLYIFSAEWLEYSKHSVNVCEINICVHTHTECHYQIILTVFTQALSSHGQLSSFEAIGSHCRFLR